MNNQNSAQRLLRNFRQQGVTRQAANLFGQPVDASPVALMLETFAGAGLTRREPSFFGITLHGQTAGRPSQGQVKPAGPGKLFILPTTKREAQEMAYAA